MPTYPRTGSAWHERYYDDYTSYLSQNAYELAYPAIYTWETFPTSWTANHSSVYYATWSPTNGPGDVPGVRARLTNNLHFPISLGEWAYGEFARTVMTMTGTEFRGVARILNRGYVIINIGRYTPESTPGAQDDGTDYIVALTTGHMWQSDPNEAAFSDVGVRLRVPFRSWLWSGLWPLGTVADIEIMGQVGSTGYIRVLFNGTEILLYEGPVTSPQANFVLYQAGGYEATENGGRITNTGLYDVVDASGEPIPDEPDDETLFCDCQPPSSSQTQGKGSQPFLTPTIGQQALCAGGGLVPTQPDLTFSENWWGA